MVSPKPGDQPHGVIERALPDPDQIDINDPAIYERGTAPHQSWVEVRASLG
jgi:hypothetical protein